VSPGVELARGTGLIERYRERLPFAAGDPVISLGEGSTPLVHAPALSERVGAEVWLKLEGLNPTGSFKDRGMTCAVSAAVREGAKAVICASTGNTSASAAAYAARAGVRCAVLVPDGKIATGKLAQALMHGARVIVLRGNFDEALQLVRELADRHPISLVNSVNRYRLEGQKTASFEIVEALGTEEPVDAFVAAVSTSATLMGAARRLREAYPGIRVVAVDAQGSVIFGGPASRRSLPGIGSSRTPELLCPEEVDEVIYVDDYDSARGCRELLRGEGILAGGSSGAVIAAVQQVAAALPPSARIATVLPDRGERYMDLVYDDAWVEAQRPAVPEPAPAVTRPAAVALTPTS